MAGTPRIEFTGKVFTAGIAQLSDDLRIVCREPILQLVQCFHTVQHRLRYDDILLCHAQIITGLWLKRQLWFWLTQTNPSAAEGRVA